MPTGRIRELVDEFVENLQNVLRDDLQAAIANLGLAIGGHRPTTTSNAHRVARGKGAKRDPAALEALSGQFIKFVSSHPGLRIEQINKELGTTTKDLALPIRKLIADGAIKTNGQKRSTTYTAAGGSTRKGNGRKRSKK
jgi:hypothetical protein